MKPITGAVATVALAATFTAMPASAGTDDYLVIKTEHVRAGDLDLSRDSDVARLYTRLRSAARRVCVVTSGSRLDFVDEGCRRRALGDAVAQVDNAALTSLHGHPGAVRQLASNVR